MNNIVQNFLNRPKILLLLMLACLLPNVMAYIYLGALSGYAGAIILLSSAIFSLVTNTGLILIFAGAVALTHYFFKETYGKRSFKKTFFLIRIASVSLLLILLLSIAKAIWMDSLGVMMIAESVAYFIDKTAIRHIVEIILSGLPTIILAILGIRLLTLANSPEGSLVRNQKSKKYLNFALGLLVLPCLIYGQFNLKSAFFWDPTEDIRKDTSKFAQDEFGWSLWSHNVISRGKINHIDLGFKAPYFFEPKKESERLALLAERLLNDLNLDQSLKEQTSSGGFSIDMINLNLRVDSDYKKDLNQVIYHWVYCENGVITVRNSDFSEKIEEPYLEALQRAKGQ